MVHIEYLYKYDDHAHDLKLRLNKEAAWLAADLLLADNVVAIQLPSVFALAAAPSDAALRMLAEVKNRMVAWKTFGSACKDFRVLENCLHPDFRSLPHARRDIWERSFKNTFLRVPVDACGFHRGTIYDGTHQSLHMTEPSIYGEFFDIVEKALATRFPKFPLPLITSMNESAVQESIGGLDGALKFLHSNGKRKLVPLLLLGSKYVLPKESRGSTPVFSLTQEGFRLERNGPGAWDVFRRLEEFGIPVEGSPS